MNLPITVTQEDLLEILLNVAPIRPVFIWGAPGIGKSALVEQFAQELDLPCVSLLGSQLAPEDIIGIPQINGETSEFLPPKMIARKEAYVLFLDELNACSQEVQKAFYSLIHERRIGEYHLPEGSIVVGAGNRAQDSAIVKTMSSALINRMFHVQMKADARQWIKWAQQNNLHPFLFVSGYPLCHIIRQFRNFHILLRSLRFFVLIFRHSFNSFQTKKSSKAFIMLYLATSFFNNSLKLFCKCAIL